MEKGVPQQEEINMAVAEQMGHDHQGKEMFRWDYTANKINPDELWDDIPIILDEIRKEKEEKFTFSVDSQDVQKKGVYVPRYYWQNKMIEMGLG